MSESVYTEVAIKDRDAFFFRSVYSVYAVKARAATPMMSKVIPAYIKASLLYVVDFCNEMPSMAAPPAVKAMPATGPIHQQGIS